MLISTAYLREEKRKNMEYPKTILPLKRLQKYLLILATTPLKLKWSR
jgi:hypothetical protein